MNPNSYTKNVFKYLAERFPADWKAAEPSTDPVGAWLWFYDPRYTARIDIGTKRLFVRWLTNDRARYGVDQPFAPSTVCTRKELDESLPGIVADIALKELESGLTFEIPFWAKEALLSQGSKHLCNLQSDAAEYRKRADRLECQYALLAGTLVRLST